jgi:hypothetical protein
VTEDCRTLSSVIRSKTWRGTFRMTFRMNLYTIHSWVRRVMDSYWQVRWWSRICYQWFCWRLNCADLTEDSWPGRIKRPRVSTVKNTDSSPPSIAWEQRPSISHTKFNPTCAGDQPTHLPLVPHTGVKKPTRR